MKPGEGSKQTPPGRLADPRGRHPVEKYASPIPKARAIRYAGIGRGWQPLEPRIRDTKLRDMKCRVRNPLQIGTPPPPPAPPAPSPTPPPPRPTPTPTPSPTAATATATGTATATATAAAAGTAAATATPAPTATATATATATTTTTTATATATATITTTTTSTTTATTTTTTTTTSTTTTKYYCYYHYYYYYYYYCYYYYATNPNTVKRKNSTFCGWKKRTDGRKKIKHNKGLKKKVTSSKRKHSWDRETKKRERKMNTSSNRMSCRILLYCDEGLGQGLRLFLNPSRARHDSSDGQEILKSSSYVLDKPPDIVSWRKEKTT